MTSATQPYMTQLEASLASRAITFVELECELADLFRNPNIRADLEAHWAVGDYHAAALVLARLVERRRIAATPERPAPVLEEPQRAGGTPAKDLRELAKLIGCAGLTP